MRDKFFPTTTSLVQIFADANLFLEEISIVFKLFSIYFLLRSRKIIAVIVFNVNTHFDPRKLLAAEATSSYTQAFPIN
jgi:ribosomal protein L4